jgi:hypothetical protein
MCRSSGEGSALGLPLKAQSHEIEMEFKVVGLDKSKERKSPFGLQRKSFKELTLRKSVKLSAKPTLMDVIILRQVSFSCDNNFDWIKVIRIFRRCKMKRKSPAKISYLILQFV